MLYGITDSTYSLKACILDIYKPICYLAYEVKILKFDLLRNKAIPKYEIK